MLSFKTFITEARAGGYDDEHALVHLWNNVTSHPEAKKMISHPDAGLIQQEIEKAKKDPKHPLNAARAPAAGFTGGNTENHEAYYKELHHAASTVHALANHPTLKKAALAGAQAEVTGASSKGKLSDLWKKHGAGNATSKADIKINHKTKTGTTSYPVSLKKGDAQLMSAQPEEFGATYEHAFNEHMKQNPQLTQKHKKKVMDRVEKIKTNLRAMKTAPREEHHALAAEAQAHLDAIHKDHPDLLKHVAYEASTGHGKFGHGQEGTARLLVTSLPDGAHIHDTETNNEPIVTKHPRIGLPKNSSDPKKPRRPGVMRLDYIAKRNKKARK